MMSAFFLLSTYLLKIGLAIEGVVKLTAPPPPPAERTALKKPSLIRVKKRCSENIQQIYRRTPMTKCDLKSHFDIGVLL